MNSPRRIILAIFITNLVIIADAMEMPPIQSNENVNIMTDMVQNITKQIKKLRDRIITIDPEVDTMAVQEAILEIQNLENPIWALKFFIEDQKKRNRKFINQLNDEGMPPRIVEEELEVTLRHDLNAIGLTLGIGTDQEDYELWYLVSEENKIYDMIENLRGPLIRFKNLKNRYPDYAIFIAENKRYTPQEAHVILHIASYVTSVNEALALAEKDSGRYLLNLLKTYVDWLPWGTHLDEDVEIVKMHGSIMSITDKNNMTMLDWTKELIKKVKEARNKLRRKNISTIFMEESLQQLRELATMLKGIKRTDTGELRKITTRSLLRPEKNVPAERGLWPYERPMTEKEKKHIERMKALNLATEKELLEVSDIAQVNPEYKKN